MADPPRIDVDELTARGYTRVPRLLDSDSLREFEGVVSAAARALARRRGIAESSHEPLIDLMKRGGQHRVRLFGMLKQLFVVQRMSVTIGDRLAAGGFLSWAGIEAPAIWPTLRVDLPDEGTYLLPMHQDYGSMHCHRAWRVWIALRDLDVHHGTMRMVPGSHTRGCLPHDTSDPNYPRVLPSLYEGQPIVELTVRAGDAILFNPLLLHESVPNRSERIKFVLLLQVQDASTLADPDDPKDALYDFARIAAVRSGGN
jgi:hypothetical protein